MTVETGIAFHCEGERLFGILHRPDVPSVDCAMVLIVGGPQYRVGSHRQFVLLARQLAESGVPVFRFDYRGMGDSSGDGITFEDIEADIRCAIDTTLTHCPDLDKVALWGLCDAAASAAMYAALDRRVGGIMLINPWVRTETGEAETLLHSYYRDRLRNAAAWKSLLTNPRKIVGALTSVLRNMRTAWSRDVPALSRGRPGEAFQLPRGDLPSRVFAGLARYDGAIDIIICEEDLTGQEFVRAAQNSAAYTAVLSRKNVRQHRIPHADHTFSRAVWRRQVADITMQWLRHA